MNNILKRRQRDSEPNVQLTKRHENATTDKLNVNPPLNRLIFRRLEVVRSLSPPDDFESSENTASKKWKRAFTAPPRENQAGEYDVISPLSHGNFRGEVG